MNKKAKIIIGILLFIIVILLVLLISCKCEINKLKNKKEDNTENNSVIGIYHSSNWNSHEATLTINKDKTCIYPNTSKNCTWYVSDDKIIITLNGSNKHEATITNNGVVLHEHLFTKIN